MPVLGTPILLLLVGICLTAGVVLLVLGLWPRSRGKDPHCRKCNYNLTGIASEICPECGTYCTAHTIVYGERYRRPGLAIAGLMLLLLGLASCIPVSKIMANRQSRQRPITVAQNSKLIVSHLITLFKSGRAARPVPSTARGSTFETVNSLGMFVSNKMPYLIRRHETNATVRAAALAELAAADQLFHGQIFPAYRAALESEAPEDAKALVPLMDHLDKHMDKLLQILRGY